MDEHKRRRGELLVEQEDVEQAIANLKQDLTKYGANYSRLGEALKTKPEQVIFSNAPDGLGSFNPGRIAAGPTFNWQDFKDLTDIATKIQELRSKVIRLQDIKAELGSR